MKFSKLALACALTLAGIHQASADVEIHIVGSTAFRAATVNAIINRLAGAQGIYTDDGSSISGSNNCVITGTVAGVSGTVTVRCAWSGSVAGIMSVTGNNNVKFLTGGTDSGGATVSPSSVSVSGSVASGGGKIHTATQTASTILPEVTMADNYQVSTKFTSPHLTDNVVGIIPFAWVSSQNAPTTITNVGPNVLKALFTSGGFMSAQVLSGNPADHATFGDVDGTLIYAIGRNNGSGTRVNAYAEPGIGINTSANQFTTNAAVVTAAGGTGPVSNVVSGIALDTRGIVINGSATAVDPGNGGEESGGQVADQLRLNTTSVSDLSYGNGARPIGFISYLGEADSYRAVAGSGSGVTGTNAGNAHYLTYNGVAGFQGSFFNDVASTTNGSTTLSAAGSANPATAFANVVAGQAIRGANIPADAVVVSVNSVANPNTIVMSTAAIGTSTTAKVTVANLIASKVRDGSYTFWGYEHIMWTTFVTDSFGAAADKTTVATAIKNQIATGGFQNGVNVGTGNKGDYFAAGIGNDSAMQVQRSTDGGPVTTQY